SLPLSPPSHSAPHVYLSTGRVEIRSRLEAHRSVVEQKGRDASGAEMGEDRCQTLRARQNQLEQVRWIDPTFGQQFRQDPLFLAQDCLRNGPFVNRGGMSMGGIAFGALENLPAATCQYHRGIARGFA